MNILGGIGLAAAIANYRKAKQDYNDALERVETLQAAVDTYTENRNNFYDDIESQKQYNQNEELEGILVTTLLRIGNLTQEFFKVQTSVILTNAGDKEITIVKAAAVCRILGAVVGVDEQQETFCNTLLMPGNTIEIQLPSGNGGISKAQLEELKNTICTAEGKKYITSCKNVSINGVETADVRFSWKAANGSGESKQARYENKKGTLRYCGEAYYPKK